MRYIAAYFLMLFYLIVMFKPLIPVICDVWAHIFAEAEHIATVHAKYGSNHLESDLAKSGADSDNSKNQPSTWSEESSPNHLFIEEYNYDFSFNNVTVHYYLPKPDSLPNHVLSKLVPPPKFS